MPFGGGGLLRRLLPRPLPPVAAEMGCTSWAQALLKFVLGHPAVTSPCAILGTIGDRPMTSAERVRRHRAARAQEAAVETLVAAEREERIRQLEAEVRRLQERVHQLEQERPRP